MSEDEKIGVTTVETEPGLVASLFGGTRTKTTVPASKDDLPKKEEPKVEKINVGNWVLNLVIEGILLVVGTIAGYILFQKVGGSPSPIMLLFLLILNYHIPGLKYLMIISIALLPIFYGKQMYSSKNIQSIADLATRNVETIAESTKAYRPTMPKINFRPSIPAKFYKPSLPGRSK